MVEKKTMSCTVRKGQTAKDCKTCILSVQYPFHYFMYFCWSKYFPWIQKLFSSKLFDWYSQLFWWSPPLVQIKQWQWPAQGERYLHCQSERKMDLVLQVNCSLWTILWCDHRNATSLTVLLHATIILHYFTKWTLEFVLNFYFKQFWEWKG